MIRIKQLGNGGGLNPLMTNSSFLIEYSINKYLLFDCGFNIMERLIKEEENDDKFKISQITHVFISHVHDDHVGNLETLIFYNYFKNNVVTNILCGNDDVSKYAASKYTKILSGCRLVHPEMFTITRLFLNQPVPFKLDNTNLYITENYHGDKESNGLIIKDAIYGNCIFISGDTKANPDIEKRVCEQLDNYKTNLLFHDFSYWNVPSKNVHACKNDFEAEYSDVFKSNIIKYHTGDDDFNKNWYKL